MLPRFVASMSDLQHAIYGAFANMFYTGDRRLFKKVEAIYEYLEIGNRIYLISTANESNV